jgi:hypothetical protein
LVIEHKIQGPDHSNVAALLDNLAALYHAQKHSARAEGYYHRALVLREEIQNERDLAPTVRST